jgi:hypothetical protein
MSERMSVGEQMVWAAAFALAREQQRDDPNRFHTDGSWNEPYLVYLAQSAAEAGSAAVSAMRDAERSSLEAFGAGSSTAEMLRIMSGEEP